MKLDKRCQIIVVSHDEHFKGLKGIEKFLVDPA
jgi:hypothetical protein